MILCFICSFHTHQFQARLSTKELDAYAKAANVAEEVLSGIRTVFAFNGEKLEAERYNQRLLNAKLAVRLKGLLSGIGDGTVLFLFYASNALAFWYGVKLVLRDRHKAEKQYTPTVLMIVCQRNNLNRYLFSVNWN